MSDETQTQPPTDPLGPTAPDASGETVARSAVPDTADATGTVAQPADQASRVGEWASSARSSPTVPGFELEAELGRGAMGVVYKARQVGLNRAVALKMVLAGPYADAGTRARFLIEAEAVAALEHPHVVRVFAFGEHDGFPTWRWNTCPAVRSPTDSRRAGRSRRARRRPW